MCSEKAHDYFNRLLKLVTKRRFGARKYDGSHSTANYHDEKQGAEETNKSDGVKPRGHRCYVIKAGMVRGYYSVKAAEVKRLCAGHLVSCTERVNRVETPISDNLAVWKELSRDPGFEPKYSAGLGKTQNFAGFDATLVAGFAKILARDEVLGKKKWYLGSR